MCENVCEKVTLSSDSSVGLVSVPRLDFLMVPSFSGDDEQSVSTSMQTFLSREEIFRSKVAFLEGVARSSSCKTGFKVNLHFTTTVYPYTNKREPFLTSLPNSSWESAPIGTYDIPFDSACHVEQTGGMRFPEFSALLE